MNNLIRFPLVVFAFAFFAMWFSARIGVFLRKKWRDREEDERENLDLIIGATLTLLGLLIGFSFSMAISRYDLRKNFEEAEANAIGTEYVRADFLPPADAVRVRTLLREYLDQRLLFYKTRDEHQRQKINADTAQLQTGLWSAVRAPAAAQPTPVLALTVSGMNDVLNSQGYTQSAWWNRIPIAAWGLMAVVAICANLLVGYTVRSPEAGLIRLVILPLILCIAFFLIADIDSPRRGIIRVSPQNLMSLSESLPGH